MRIFNSVSHPITAIAALAMLGACSGGGSQMAPMTARENIGATTLSVPRQGLQGGPNSASVQRLPVTTPSFMDPAAVGKPLVFAANINGGYVNIYLQRGTNKMVGQITGLMYPEGLATDAAGNLYVANFGGMTVPVYAPPYTGPPALTLDDTGNVPAAVAVSAEGVVAVTNYCTAPSSSCPSGSGSVSFYAKNSTTPCATVLADPTSFSYLLFPAFDHKGNLYITGSYGSGSHTVSVIGEAKGECNAKKISVLKTKNTIRAAWGIRIAKGGRIAIQDSWCCKKAHSVNHIYTYDAPIKGSLGAPVSMSALKSPRNSCGFAFVASGKNLYTAEWNNSSTDFADEYHYPAGGAAEDVITVQGGGGVCGPAVTPPLIP